MNAWPIRILHLGLGRFHRAHQAVYYQDLFEKTGAKWGVVSFSMRSADARDEMRRVHNHYPVVQFSRKSAKIQWIDSVRSSYFLIEDRAKFLEIFGSKDLSIVTLTVTEKAYASPELYEALYAGLQSRRFAGHPLTILSCDNLLENGAKLRAGVLDYARKNGDALMIAWIEKNIAFPCSMVDRIVPALTPERVIELQKQFDTDNAEILATETFSQWVIEDRFHASRPPLADVGVQIVKDVKPYEEMKLRLLNASHSQIAYAGLKKGYRFVHEAIRDSEIRDRVLNLYAEVRPLLSAPPELNLETYCASLIERFDNENLPHQLIQIAMDGSEKMKQRILPSIAMAEARSLPASELAGVLKSWAEFCFANVPQDPKRDKIEDFKKSTSGFEDFSSKLYDLIGARSSAGCS